MALTVIGGTGNLASVLCSDTALRVHSETTQCKEGYGDHVKLASAHLFPLDVLFYLAELEGWRSRQPMQGVAWEGIICAEPIRPDYTLCGGRPRFLGTS